MRVGRRAAGGGEGGGGGMVVRKRAWEVGRWRRGLGVSMAQGRRV